MTLHVQPRVSTTRRAAGTCRVGFVGVARLISEVCR